MLEVKQLRVGQLLSYNGHDGQQEPCSLWLLVKEEFDTQQSLWKEQPHPKRAFQLYNMYERYNALDLTLTYYCFSQEQCRSFKVVSNVL